MWDDLQSVGDNYVIFNGMALLTALKKGEIIALENYGTLRIVGHNVDEGVYLCSRYTTPERRVQTSSLQEVTDFLNARGIGEFGSRYYLNVETTGSEEIAQKLSRTFANEPLQEEVSQEPSYIRQRFGRCWKRYKGQQEYQYFLD